MRASPLPPKPPPESTASPVGFVVALRAEARALARRNRDSARPRRTDDDLRIRVAGVGPERAAVAARELLASGASGLVSWGTAAGLAPDCASGTLVIPERVLGADQAVHEVERTWREELLARLPPDLQPDPRPIAETVSILADESAKSSFAHQSGACAADMESAAVARVAAQAGTPFLAVRAIVDSRSMRLPGAALAALAEDGGTRPIRIWAALGRRPMDIFPLARIALGFVLAHHTLARVARGAGPRWALRTSPRTPPDVV